MWDDKYCNAEGQLEKHLEWNHWLSLRIWIFQSQKVQPDQPEAQNLWAFKIFPKFDHALKRVIRLAASDHFYRLHQCGSLDTNAFLSVCLGAFCCMAGAEISALWCNPYPETLMDRTHKDWSTVPTDQKLHCTYENIEALVKWKFLIHWFYGISGFPITPLDFDDIQGISQEATLHKLLSHQIPKKIMHAGNLQALAARVVLSWIQDASSQLILYSVLILLAQSYWTLARYSYKSKLTQSRFSFERRFEDTSFVQQSSDTLRLNQGSCCV